MSIKEKQNTEWKQSWGRSIDLIRNACTAHGSPAPRFASDSTGVEVVFAFAAVETSVQTLVETPVKTLVETPIKTPTAILQQLERNPTMTLAEVATAIDKSISAVERASAKLIQAEKLRYVGPRKGGHWEILK